MALNIRNGSKIDQMPLNFTNMFHCKTLQNLLKFWFESIPSGNLDSDVVNLKVYIHVFLFVLLLHTRSFNHSWLSICSYCRWIFLRF
jgi:hypothetical protein